MGTKGTLEKKQQIFLSTLRETFSVYHAAQAAGVDRRTAYKWRAKDAAFAAQWDEAKEAALDVLEASAYEQALAGNHVLTIFLLKHNREKYHERRDAPDTADRRPVILQCLHHQEGPNGQSGGANDSPRLLPTLVPEEAAAIPREWR